MSIEQVDNLREKVSGRESLEGFGCIYLSESVAWSTDYFSFRRNATVYGGAQPFSRNTDRILKEPSFDVYFC